jgi:hypothetical protein
MIQILLAAVLTVMGVSLEPPPAAAQALFNDGCQGRALLYQSPELYEHCAGFWDAVSDENPDNWFSGIDPQVQGCMVGEILWSGLPLEVVREKFGALTKFCEEEVHGDDEAQST